eukprot:5372-Heterococcus_DN1.PRE.1
MLTLIQQADEEVVAVKQRIVCPGQFLDSMQEVTRLVSVEVYDGMKFDLQKQLSQQFGVAHSLTLGSSLKAHISPLTVARQLSCCMTAIAATVCLTDSRAVQGVISALIVACNAAAACTALAKLTAQHQQLTAVMCYMLTTCRKPSSNTMMCMHRCFRARA